MSGATTKEKDPCFIYRRVSSPLACAASCPPIAHHGSKIGIAPGRRLIPFIIEPPRHRISLLLRLAFAFSYPYSPEPIKTCWQSGRGQQAPTAQIRLIGHVLGCTLGGV